MFLQIKPGTNIALLNGMINVILDKDLHDREYIEERTENFEEFEILMREYTPEVVAEICGVDPEDIVKLLLYMQKQIRLEYTMPWELLNILQEPMGG